MGACSASFICRANSSRTGKISSNPLGGLFVFRVLIFGIDNLLQTQSLASENQYLSSIRAEGDKLELEVRQAVQKKMCQVFYIIIMLSYLANRHYHLLTKELPEQMRTDQPKVVYLPAHNTQKITYKPSGRSCSKLKVKRSKQMSQANFSMGDCCPTCFSIDNIAVDFYGKKHVCVKCRKLIRDEHGNQIRIFVNEVGQIVCLGIKISKKEGGPQKKVYYYTDYTQLQINGHSAFATFANPDEMVIILRLAESSQQ